MTTGNNFNIGQFGDTTLTKVFVGGLAWETPKEAMRDHFHKYGEILEAVIISDKVTGRSKGYGFVTFKDPEAAKKACEDTSPIINGRRANCNLASLGARTRLPKSSSNTTPPHHHQQQGPNLGPRSMSPAPASHVQWYYPAIAGNPVSPFHHQHIQHQHQHQHQATVPLYGYSPAYFTTDYSYTHQKVGYSGGTYMGMGGHISQVYPTGQAMIGGNNTLMPMYQQHPLNYHHYHQSPTMGLPTHMFPGTTITSVPTIMSKPAPFVPNNPAVCLAVE